MSRIIKTGMQIVCDRKNHSRPEAEKKAEAVIDPKYIKFYTAIDENIERATAEGKKSKPMFKCELIMPDENGAPKSEVVMYEMIAPDQIAMLYGIMQQRLAPPSQRGRPGGPRKDKDSPADADSGTEANDAQDAAEADEAAAGDDDEADALRAPRTAPAPAPEAPKKSASEKAREIASGSTKKAKAATPTAPQLSEAETSHLFDE